MSDPVLPGAALALPEESATTLAISGEEALPGDAVALAPEIESDDAVAMAPDAVPTSSIANKPALGNKVADVLLMYDSMLADGDEARTRQLIELYAKYALSTATLESFYGYEGLVSKLQAYRTIRELVLFIHGEPGGFSVIYENRSHMRPLSLVVEEDFQGVAPQVTNQVILESCVIARAPSQMIKLRNLFQAPLITGWNYWHVLDLWKLPLIGNVSADQIRGALQIPDDYLLSGMPHPVTYAGQAGTFTFMYEWFRDIQDDTPPGLNPNRSVFVPRGNASAISLVATDAACMTRLKDPSKVLDPHGAKDLKALCDENNAEGLVDYLVQVTIRD